MHRKDSGLLCLPNESFHPLGVKKCIRIPDNPSAQTTCKGVSRTRIAHNFIRVDVQSREMLHNHQLVSVISFGYDVASTRITSFICPSGFLDIFAIDSRGNHHSSVTARNYEMLEEGQEVDGHLRYSVVDEEG